jgi:intron-binding protein aquarius
MSQIEALNDMALYPTEQILWDENIVPSQYYSGQGICRAVSSVFTFVQ